MAIKKIFDTEFGNTAEYWKISSISAFSNKEGCGMYIHLYGYVNEKARKGGSEYISEKSVYISSEKMYDLSKDEDFVEAYNILKTTEEFEGAEDII